jgi:toxin ParE1/3/4
VTGRYVLSPCAQADLEDIWDYAASRWGLDQAERCTRQLWRRMDFPRHV